MTHADLASLAGEHRRRLRETIPPDLAAGLVDGRILRRLDLVERLLSKAAASSSGRAEESS